MKVLVACEMSGIVREAFRRRGHDAWSCDLCCCELGPDHHIRLDVLDVLGDGWDLMIAHPPCTHLCVSGALYFKQKRADGRQQEAIDFFIEMTKAPIRKIAIENPVGIMSTVWRKPDQIIQPWMFGEDESKATCLWLQELHPLKATFNVRRPAWIPCPDGCDDLFCQRHEMHTADCPCPPIDDWVKVGDDPYRKRYSNQCPSGQNKLGPSPTRAQQRSRTYAGIAEAMALQWG
jgi:hypothetical protein